MPILRHASKSWSVSLALARHLLMQLQENYASALTSQIVAVTPLALEKDDLKRTTLVQKNPQSFLLRILAVHGQQQLSLQPHYRICLAHTEHRTRMKVSCSAQNRIHDIQNISRVRSCHNRQAGNAHDALRANGHHQIWTA